MRSARCAAGKCRVLHCYPSAGQSLATTFSAASAHRWGAAPPERSGRRHRRLELLPQLEGCRHYATRVCLSPGEPQSNGVPGGESGASEIDPTEVSFIRAEDVLFDSSESGEGGGGVAGGTCASADPLRGCGSRSLPSHFTDVTHLDSFSRARIINFVKRYTKGDVARSNGSPACFELEELKSEHGESLYHAFVKIPVSTELGPMWGHGLACSVKDAELLAAMHAEQIIDALGYHIYTLSSMQKKHAEAARKAGRWAPMPDDGDRANEDVVIPLPLRRVIDRDESEGGKWQLLDTKPLHYIAPHHTLLSPCIIDPGSTNRIGKLLEHHRLSYAHLCTTKEIAPLKNGGAAHFHCTLVLPPSLTSHSEVLAEGMAVDRHTAETLAAMHAELLLDTLGIAIYPYDADTQERHAKAARGYGRRAPDGIHEAPIDPLKTLLPLPLKQLVVEKGGERFSSLTYEEDLVRRHRLLSEAIFEFRDISYLDHGAVRDLEQFLAERQFPRTNPFFVERIASAYKATVVLPLPDRYGIRGAVGLAPSSADATVLASMHALDVLNALGIPVCSDTEAQAVWVERRRSHGESVPATTEEDSAIPSPPGCRRLIAGLQAPSTRPVGVACGGPSKLLAEGLSADEKETPACTTASKASSDNGSGGAPEEAPSAPRARRRVAKRVVAVVPDQEQSGEQSSSPTQHETHEPPAPAAPTAPRRYMEQRDSVGKEYWDLTADTPDGFILVSSRPMSDHLLHAHALLFPRNLDVLSKERVFSYLSTMGKRPEDAVIAQFLDESENGGQPMHRCIIKLPTPSRFGDRFALGESADAKDAESLAAMHAELILDTLGIPLYLERHLQAKHAEVCAKYGRYAPVVGDEPQPDNTPSPPPLRRESPASLFWEAKLKIQSRSISRKGAQGTSLPGDSVESQPPNGTMGCSGEDGEPHNVLLSEEPGFLPASEADRSAGRQYEFVADTELDPLSRERVRYYLRRINEKGSIEPTYHVEVFGTGSIMHVAKMVLPAPPKFGVRMAIGTSYTKREAEILCWMHAERILDALGIHIFNLPGLQRYHVQRVQKLGRRAPAPEEVLHVDGDTPSPLALCIGTSMPKPSYPAEPAATVAERVWETYAHACQEYVELCTMRIHNQFYELEKVPRTGDDIFDAALEDVEKEAIDKNAKMLLALYCVRSNVNYPTYWKSVTVGPIMRRLCLTSVEVPGYEHVMAKGIGMNKDNSQRRAAMHAIALLRRIDPDFASMEQQLRVDVEKCDTSQSNAADMDSLLGGGAESMLIMPKTLKINGRKEKDRLLGSWDLVNRELTSEGRMRTVQLYTLCYGLPPPVVKHMSRLENKRIVQYTQVEVVDEDGKLWVGREGKGGQRTNAPLAYDHLFKQLCAGVPGFLELEQLISQHPFLRAEHIPSITVPPEIKAKLDDVLGSTMLDEAEEPVAEISKSWWEGKEGSNVFSAVKKEKLSEVLRNKLELKLASEEYQQQFAEKRAKLSISEKSAAIVDAIISNRVVIICGTTGCGKTTQVPQFILDHMTMRGEGESCNILVTQPRRLSAVSIAQRVAAERLEAVGETCGYAIRLDSKPGTNINFCTSGVLLRMLYSNPTLEGIDFLIIDEIHERDINSDFLLILLNDLLRVRTDLRVILMSATLQAELFSRYFNGAPVIQVEGYVYPVQELFLEDLVAVAESQQRTTPLLKEAAATLDKGEADSSDLVASDDGDGSRKATSKYGFLEATTEIDYPTIQFAIEHAMQSLDLLSSSVLVFLPGWDEIVKAKEILERDSKLHIICLHSSVSSEEQLRCFLPAPAGKTKLILSTNIAESGVTIDDIGVVIDVGRAKEKSFVTERGRTVLGKNEMGSMSQLSTIYASRANCVQRRGRVGRTRPGMCIRLFSRKHFASLHDFQTPEMLRVPLDSLCLQILALDLGDPNDFLQKGLEPPSAESVSLAMNTLHELGAATSDGRLTPLGLQLSQLPVSPKVGKMIVMGAVLRCLDSALTIAAVSDADVFESSREHRDAVRMHREDLSLGTQSDHIASVNGYNYWVSSHNQKTPTEVMYDLQERTLSIPQLLQVSRYKRQFFEILRESGFLGEELKNSGMEPQDPTKTIIFVDSSEFSVDALNVGLVKCVVASGLFPNVAMSRSNRLLRNKLQHHISSSTSSVIRRTAQSEMFCPYFVYDEMAKASDSARTILRGISSVPIWSMLLIGTSSMPLTYRDDLGLGFIDGWIPFRVSFGTLELIRRFKRALSTCLSRKYVAPNDEENNQQLELLRQLVKELVSTPLKPNDLTDHMWEERGHILPPATHPSPVVAPCDEVAMDSAEQHSDSSSQ